ncbi:MAG: histidine--tRNA ligase [Bacteriovoracaceae bacterium]
MIQRPRGTKDILPKEQIYFKNVEKTFSETVEKAGFSKITFPTFEDAKLFNRSIGKDTDVIEKEMYTFSDKSGNLLALRPEGTASVMRAYIENGMQSWSQPVKLYYFGPFFRYDRPQAGRYREFFQFGLEVIGDNNPLVDASLIATAWRIYKKLNIENLTIELNSIGCGTCRPKYEKLLKSYYQDQKGACKDCLRRLKTKPIRVLDCKNEKCLMIQHDAPQLINNLCSSCHDHFKTVLEYLDELEIPYQLNPKIVRGLDYYTNTVFEIWNQKEKAQNSLGGGGRYDGLAEILGSSKKTGIGFAGGVERVIDEIKKEEIEVSEQKKIDVFVAQLGDKARKKCFRLLNDLLDAGIGVETRFDRGGIGDQLRIASNLGVAYTLLIGQREAFDETVIIKEMDSGNQEIFPYEKIVREMQKRLKK